MLLFTSLSAAVYSPCAFALAALEVAGRGPLLFLPSFLQTISAGMPWSVAAQEVHLAAQHLCPPKWSASQDVRSARSLPQTVAGPGQQTYSALELKATVGCRSVGAAHFSHHFFLHLLHRVCENDGMSDQCVRLGPSHCMVHVAAFTSMVRMEVVIL